MRARAMPEASRTWGTVPSPRGQIADHPGAFVQTPVGEGLRLRQPPDLEHAVADRVLDPIVTMTADHKERPPVDDALIVQTTEDGSGHVRTDADLLVRPDHHRMTVKVEHVACLVVTQVPT